MSKIKRVRLKKNNIEKTLGGLRQFIPMTYAKTAFELGYDVDFYPQILAMRISDGKKFFYVQDAATSLNSFVSARIADNKFMTNKLLEEAGLPVSRSLRLRRDIFFSGDWNLEGLKYPLVVKPNKGTESGHGVFTDIRSAKELKKKLAIGFDKHKYLLIEEFQKNLKDYRVLVLDGKVIAVSLRAKAYIIGDGKQTVIELIAESDEARLANQGFRLVPLKINAAMKRKLKSQRMTLQSIPQDGQNVELGNICNIGAGGQVEDATDVICETNKKIAIKAAHVLGLRLAGLDILCEDISKPLNRTRGVIIEINQHPGITPHHFPFKGKARKVARPIIRAMFRRGI